MRKNRPKRGIRSFLRRGKRRLVHSDRWEWHQLDVQVPTSRKKKKIPRRRRGGFWKMAALHAFCLLCLSVTVPMGIRWVHNHYVVKSEDFRLLRLQIQSNGSLSESKIAKTAQVQAGMDLMGVDIQSVRDRVEGLPYVKHARVRRELPDLLVIDVKERIPLAWLSCPRQGIRPLSVEHGYLIDREGAVFRCLDLSEQIRVLPVVELERAPEIVEGITLELAELREAIHLLRKSDTLLEAKGFQISELKIKGGWMANCRYRNGLVAQFSLRDLDRGLHDLVDIVGALGEKSQLLDTVNLAVTKNIPVTFREEVDKTLLQSSLQESEETSPAPVNPVEEKRQKHLRSILRGG